jgi:hypothetical protein
VTVTTSSVAAAADPRVPWTVFLAAAVLGLATAVVRYLGVNGFSNDHYLYLAGAQQILFGEWPTRDFVDIGAPLMSVTSAAAQLVFGRTLVAEATLVSIAYALASAAVVFAAWRVSRSLLAAVAASVLSIAAFPRSYAYPKLLLFAVAPLCIWAWVRRPTVARLAAIAVCVSVAFLFRHDFGAFLGLASFATIALAPGAGLPETAKRLGIFVGFVLVCLLPYFAYVQTHVGLIGYFQDAIAFSQREADRTQLPLAAIQPGHEARLFYLFRALPIAALAWLIADWRQGWSTHDLMAVPLVVAAMFVTATFLRDPLAARLPDVVVPVVLVGAWLAGRSMVVSSRLARTALIVVLAAMAVSTGVSLAAVERAPEQLHRTNLWLGAGELPRLLREKTSELQERFARAQLPDGRLLPLVPFFEYLDRCTTARHHLLVAGNAPEIYVYARRPFAAGQLWFVEGYFHSEHEQRRQLERATKQVVAFALVLSDQYADWKSWFPRLDAFVQSSFRPLTEIPIDDERTVRVLVHGGLPPNGVDRSTGWPCFR